MAWNAPMEKAAGAALDGQLLAVGYR